MILKNVLVINNEFIKRMFVYKQTNIAQKWSKAKPRLAFTLAEVLITLGIIGIVAAMTIPTLQANYQKQEYVTKLKKAYTILNQSLISLANDMGCPGDLKCTGLFDATHGIHGQDITANQTLGTEFIKYFKIIKNCETSASGSSITGCWAEVYFQNYDKSGQHISEQLSSYRFLTADGMGYMITSGDCSDTSANKTGHLKQNCGHISVDINGPNKPPNSFGRDLFAFWISNGKGPVLYPVGGLDEAYHVDIRYWKDVNGCTPSNKEGVLCVARIMDEGWQMNY